MLRERSATLYLDARSWRVTFQNKESQSHADGRWSANDAASVAEDVARVVDEATPRVRRVAVLLSSSLCLTAQFQMESPRLARKREAVLYRLEEFVPIAAEDMCADFVRHGSKIFAVATERVLLDPLIAVLRTHELKIDLVAPLASLAWQHQLQRDLALDRRASAWINPDGSGDLVILERRFPTCWASFQTQSELCQQLNYEYMISGEALPLEIYGPAHVWDTGLEASETIANLTYCHLDGDTQLNHGKEELAAIRKGRSVAVLDLWRGYDGASSRESPLAFEIGLLQLVGLFLLCTLLVTSLAAARKYSVAVDRVVADQEDVWRKTFPNTRLPRGVGPRLQSELAKLAGARVDADESISDVSVVPLVYSFFRALPTELRFRLLDVKIDGNSLDLTGEVRDFADADKVAAALRGVGFLATPPTTRRLPTNGVGLRLQARFEPTPKEKSVAK